MSRVSGELYRLFRGYIARFNAEDEELYSQDYPNAQAEAFLAEQIPFFECPDKEMEETYYFRWWTYRKHVKSTQYGHIITEFLPPVPWSGPENSIVCPACFHIREGRWLADPGKYLEEYIQFWLNGHGSEMTYSSWLPHSVWEYCSIKDDFDLGVRMLLQMVDFYRRREAAQGRTCGLYWSDDGRDGMEYSISGPGLRPTINSYAWADALAISKFAALAGQEELRREFAFKADALREKIDSLLWHEGFYRTIPAAEDWNEELASRPAVEAAHDARELVGYVPWYFGLPGGEKSTAFRRLMDEKAFLAPWGLTTAEQSHPRFMEEFDHECLWNGPVWPFATSQVLVAAANLLHDGQGEGFGSADYYRLLLQYARSHHRTWEDGKRVCWIDENQHPYTGEWLARKILETTEYLAIRVPERGKDYNHSLYCDLVLSGLLGIRVEEGQFVAEPLIPADWTYFRVEGLRLHGRTYGIYYDRDGERYHQGAGLTVRAMD